jgi:nucleotide-binding universal stress UspA family protein
MSGDPIVVGTDGSSTAERAVNKAGELARDLQATLHVVSSYVSTSVGALMAASGGIAVAELVTAEQAQARAEAILERDRKRLAAEGVSVRTHVCSGEAAQALIQIAEQEQAQMIVVGNRGMTGTRRVLGSVPNRVSHHAGCAVLIVPTRD